MVTPLTTTPCENEVVGLTYLILVFRTDALAAAIRNW